MAIRALKQLALTDKGLYLEMSGAGGCHCAIFCIDDLNRTTSQLLPLEIGLMRWFSYLQAPITSEHCSTSPLTSSPHLTYGGCSRGIQDEHSGQLRLSLEHYVLRNRKPHGKVAEEING